MRHVIACSSGTNGTFSIRAWNVITGVREISDISLVVDGAGDIPIDCDRAIVFNHEEDKAVILRMVSLGIPITYCLDVGPVVNGEIYDRNAYSPEFIADRRQKMTVCSHVQVDTHVQQRAAQEHYNMKPMFAVIPPATDVTKKKSSHVTPKTLLWNGNLDQIKLRMWASTKGMDEWYIKSEHEMVNQSLKRNDVAVLWGEKSQFGERLLGVISTGTPVAAVRCGILEEDETVEWYDGNEYEEAVSRSMEKPFTEKSSIIRSWSEWAQDLLSATGLK